MIVEERLKQILLYRLYIRRANRIKNTPKTYCSVSSRNLSLSLFICRKIQVRHEDQSFCLRSLIKQYIRIGPMHLFTHLFVVLSIKSLAL